MIWERKTLEYLILILFLLYQLIKLNTQSKMSKGELKPTEFSNAFYLILFVLALLFG